MVFVYLPIYFGFGVILFFVWRWIILLQKRYRVWKRYRRRSLSVVQGDSQNRTAPVGNLAGAVFISLVVAFVIGLVGFAIGRATLPKGVFATDFPEGWGPLGFEIPAIVVGVLVASFFAAGSTRPKRAADASAKDGAEDEWLRLDRSRALLVAASALFLAFAALQYDYKLLGEVTKFSAGPVVSLELAQPAQNAKDTGNSGSKLSGSLVAAAPRRQADKDFEKAEMKTHSGASPARTKP